MFLLNFFGGIEGFEAEVILNDVLPKLKIFLYAHLPVLIDGGRRAVLDELLIKEKISWQLVDLFSQDTDLDIFARGKDQIWTNICSL